MNTYEIERIDRHGNPMGKRKIAADTFSIEDNGTLWFYDQTKGDSHNPAGVTHVFAPGTWDMITLIDPAETERLAAETAMIAREAVEWARGRQSPVNTITHPVASDEQMKELIQGATITTTHDDDQWHPITGTAVYTPPSLFEYDSFSPVSGTAAQYVNSIPTGARVASEAEMRAAVRNEIEHLGRVATGLT